MRDWEQCYQNGETPWDRGIAAPPLLEVLERHELTLWGTGPVLVPGCGLGYDVRQLAGCGLQVLGVDLAPTAVAKAREVAPVAGASYELGDFLDPEWRVGRSFTAIWEHTCFCAIDPAWRGRYAAAAAGLLSAGQVLAGVFYLTPDAGPDDSGPPFKVSIADLDEIFGPWFERIDGWQPQRAYPGREGREWVGVFRKREAAAPVPEKS